MSPALRYPEMIRQVSNPLGRAPGPAYDLRLRLVSCAKEIGVKPTARLFGSSPQTVRLWVGRYASAGRPGLAYGAPLARNGFA